MRALESCPVFGRKLTDFCPVFDRLPCPVHGRIRGKEKSTRNTQNRLTGRFKCFMEGPVEAKPMLQVRKRIMDRKAIAQARKPGCELCGRPGVVHVHHIRSRGAGGGDEPENLISLCPECHAKAHAGQVERGKLRQIAERRERWKSAGFQFQR